MLLSKYLIESKRYFIQKDKKFLSWLDEIEILVKEKFGLNLLDLPDELYREYFEEELLPKEVFEIIIKRNDYLL